MLSETLAGHAGVIQDGMASLFEELPRSPLKKLVTKPIGEVNNCVGAREVFPGCHSCRCLSNLARSAGNGGFVKDLEVPEATALRVTWRWIEICERLATYGAN